MATVFRLTIHTPDSTVFDADVISVTAPGSEGYLGVLARHAPIITGLGAGKLTLRLADGRLDDFAVSGGFLSVADNRATILADACEHVSSIDLARAREAEKRARQRLQTHGEHLDAARSEAALRRAVNRQRLSQGGDGRPAS